MLTTKGIAAGLLAGLLGLSSFSVWAQNKSESAGEKADEAAIHDYVLTMPKLQTYAAASHEFANAKKDPELAEEAKKLELDDKSSMLEKAAVIEAKCPHVSAWIKQHGMTVQEFVLIPITLITASLGEASIERGGKAADFVNPANVQFVKAHKDEIEKLDIKADESE